MRLDRQHARVQAIRRRDLAREMLRSIVAVGTDVDAQGAIRSGSILLEAMTIAGG